MNYLNGNHSASQHGFGRKPPIIGSLEWGKVCDWQSLLFTCLQNLQTAAARKMCPDRMHVRNMATKSSRKQMLMNDKSSFDHQPKF